MNLLRTLASVSGFTLLSRVTGLIRETLTARLFGAGEMTDAFFIAFRIPNLLRRLFAEGAFSQAFVPLLAQSKSVDGLEMTKQLIDRVATVLFWAVTWVTVLGVVFANAVIAAMASGLVAGSEQYTQATLMTRVMFPYIIFMSLVALASGVLNTWKNFKTPAFTPVLLNIIVISSAVGLSNYVKPPILAMAIGVFIGGLVQLCWQLPALKKIGMLPRISFYFFTALKHEGVRKVLKQMVPATLAVSVAQLSLIINTNLATHLGHGAVSWVTYADRLMEFPTALLGVALGTILLPSLSRAHSLDDATEYKRLLNWGLRLTLLLALPAALGLGLLSEALTSVLFHYGKFDTNDVIQTGRAVNMYAFGLVGLVAVKILSSAYYAKQDIKTPVKIAIVVLVATQMMNQMFLPYFQHAALTLSIGLAACLNAAVLAFLLIRRGDLEMTSDWGGFLLKLFVALLALTALLYASSHYIDWISLGESGEWSDKIIRLAYLFAVLLGAAVVYFGTLFAMGFRIRDFKLITNS